MSVELGSVAETNSGQNAAENTPEVEELPIDHLERAGAVLLIPGAGAGDLRVVQSDGLLADYLLAGSFAQGNPILRNKKCSVQ